MDKQNPPRAAYRLQRLNETMLAQEVFGWTASEDYNYYLGFGGTGDCVFLLASCWDDPKARVLFFENQGSMAKDLFELFEMDVMLNNNIMFTPLGKIIYEHVTTRPTFKTSAHLPDKLDCNDWIHNWQAYKSRLRKAPWRELIGKFENPFPTKGIVAVCPSGGERSLHRQRFITDHEYSRLCGKLLLQNYTVVTIDSPVHLYLYPKIQHKYSIRCTSKYLEFSNGTKVDTTIETLLKIVNAATYCVTMDTWLLCYCNVTGTPVKVIQTRHNGAYIPFVTSADFIFVNKGIWPVMEIVKAQEICY